ncbi:acetylornithine deacetylase [Corynespora cassiicola Philippines]|uniref:Probable succinyl-diaminopimelate desuccinylase n=1 Tax=Corynespora cassiicola Philippines TaxID=1448308 RepID=A0A2T2NU08_CORCC|nr:acetylornithine deacetylase [Corynespora cassiicola Philippines]
MASRRPVFFNPTACHWQSADDSTEDAYRFHQKLPGYSHTPLHPLRAVAEELGLRAVYIKDEGSRLHLPSFKVLGASWGAFRAVTDRLGLPIQSDLGTVQDAARSQSVVLFAATDGNHGRAVAWIGSLLGAKVQIFVPKGLDEVTQQHIRNEGAEVTQLKASYDEAVCFAYEKAKEAGGILVQDTAFPGYEEIPKWIVQGYATMMREIDEQLEQTADLVVAPVGVGSFAQAVVTHYKRQGRGTKVLAVEPDTAACLWKSLTRGSEKPASTNTTHTIMTGLDCGSVSDLAWPILKAGVDASATISDFEAHTAREYLQSQGVSAGPCGAAGLAALRRLTPSERQALQLGDASTVVLICTEGQREYNIPRSVSIEDPVSLTQALVQIDSANPGGGTIPGPGEVEIARYIAAWQEHRDIETHWIEPTPGRPSVIGVARGSGGGKSLMLNGHIDTVTLSGYEGDALSGDIRDGKLYGRGAADMKGGVAAALAALARAKKEGLKGDVIFTGVADEEDMSIGTEQVLAAGWRADGAVVSEPTDLDMVVTHKGFVWLEVDIRGVAAHGSQPTKGIDAITKAGYFLVELDRLADTLASGTPLALLGHPSVHASMIKGGEEPASYPAKCTISVEWRTLPGETGDTVKSRIEDILRGLAERVRDFSYDVRVVFSRQPFSISEEHPLVSTCKRHIEKCRGQEIQGRAAPFWTDCALLADKGIPVVLYGPKGEGLHAKTEWTEVESIRIVADTLWGVAQDFCT